ncbi:MAG: hypothetical protein ACTHJ8_01970 [Mucilaginibacter sp.]
MAQALVLTDQEQVTEHIKKLEPGLGRIIEELRQITLALIRKLTNALNGTIPAFIIPAK